MILIDHGGTSASNQGSFFRQRIIQMLPHLITLVLRFTNSSGSNTNTDIQVSHTDYITFNDNPNVLVEPSKWIQLIEYY